MTSDELVSTVLKLLTPKSIKRREIRRDLQELNRLYNLRNQAYSKSDPWPLIQDELDLQSSSSLDRTHTWIQTQLKHFDFWTEKNYIDIIAENREKEFRRIASEEAAKILTVNLKELN